MVASGGAAATRRPVTGQNDQTWFDRAGNFHSADMLVVERWTPTSPATMRYEATIADPATSPGRGR